MTRVLHYGRTFADRAEAERCFDSLQSTAWPYVWYHESIKDREWKVIALVESQLYSRVA